MFFKPGFARSTRTDTEQNASRRNWMDTTNERNKTRDLALNNGKICKLVWRCQTTHCIKPTSY